MNEKMQRSLQKTLRADEKILWESYTQPFRILDGNEGLHTLLRWVFSTVIIGGLIVGFAVGGATDPWPYIGMIVILALLIVTPIFQQKTILGQHYCITDRRAMAIRADGTVYDMLLADMGEARLYPLDFGGAAIALGSVLLEEKDKQLRWRASHPNESADASGVTGVRGLVFYHIENPEKAMRILSSAATPQTVR